MRKFSILAATATLGLLFASAAVGDTLELKDGRVLQGHYLGGTKATLRFEVNGEIQTFNVTEIIALTFTGNTGNAASSPAAATLRVSPTPQPQVSSSGDSVTIPAGQSILVR